MCPIFCILIQINPNNGTTWAGNHEHLHEHHHWIGFREIYRKPCGCSIPIMNPLMLRSLLLSLWTHGLHFSAQLCLGGRPSLSTTSLEIMGYTDWYTPNIVELRKKWWMMNLRKSTIPPFTPFYQFGDSEAQKSGVPYIVVRCREIIT